MYVTSEDIKVRVRGAMPRVKVATVNCLNFHRKDFPGTRRCSRAIKEAATPPSG
ncbi:MAG: hypothetical protein IJ737_02855 [Ruminococcus sp.]|nr:hypothetical protein [Ruminococcus sp.]